MSGKHVDDFYTIDYQALIPILIKGIQELNDEIKILKDRIALKGLDLANCSELEPPKLWPVIII